MSHFSRAVTPYEHYWATFHDGYLALTTASVTYETQLSTWGCYWLHRLTKPKHTQNFTCTHARTHRADHCSMIITACDGTHCQCNFMNHFQFPRPLTLQDRGAVFWKKKPARFHAHSNVQQYLPAARRETTDRGQEKYTNILKNASAPNLWLQ